MKTLNDFVIERLKLNNDSKINKLQYYNNEELEDLLNHFEFNHLFEIDKGRFMNKPYINQDEGEEIKKILLKFIKDNNCKKENFKYYTNKWIKFKDKKIDRDYKKGTKYIIIFGDYDDEHILFNGNYGLRFIGNNDKKTIIMDGPLGGSKICRYKEET